MLQVVLILLIVGVLLWMVNAYVPMDAKVKNILNVFVIICVVIWLLNIFGVFGLVNVPVPRVHR